MPFYWPLIKKISYDCRLQANVIIIINTYKAFSLRICVIIYKHLALSLSAARQEYTVYTYRTETVGNTFIFCLFYTHTHIHRIFSILDKGLNLSLFYCNFFVFLYSVFFILVQIVLVQYYSQNCLKYELVLFCLWT